MTSLIDVIFLLLLFFMLTSTFTRFAEFEIDIGRTSGVADEPVAEMSFLRLTEDRLTLNGQEKTLSSLIENLEAESDAHNVVVSVSDRVTAQSLSDVLVALRPMAHVNLTILGD